MIAVVIEENRSNPRENCPSVILSTIQTGLGSIPGLGNDRPTTTSLSKVNYAASRTEPRITTEPNIMTLRKAHRTVTTDGYRLLAEAVL
jgi:hypothetical protein